MRAARGGRDSHWRVALDKWSALLAKSAPLKSHADEFF